MATICLPCPAPRQCTRLSASARLSFDPSAVNRTSLFEHNDEAKKAYQGICLRRKTVHKPVLGRLWSTSAGGNSELQPISPLSPSETIEQFYDCINIKNPKKLNEFISDDCSFDDYSFNTPFKGRKEVMHFLEQLMECMGKNMKFSIESTCEGDKLTVGTMWHLEWKEKHVPFTRGCSFYECSKRGQRKARVVTESPIKPGGLVLALFKTISSLFDNFPTATEKFLHSPYAILHMLLKIYQIFMDPFIRPVFMCYINLWKLVSRPLAKTNKNKGMRMGGSGGLFKATMGSILSSIKGTSHAQDLVSFFRAEVEKVINTVVPHYVFV